MNGIKILFYYKEGEKVPLSKWLTDGKIGRCCTCYKKEEVPSTLNRVSETLRDKISAEIEKMEQKSEAIMQNLKKHEKQKYSSHNDTPCSIAELDELEDIIRPFKKFDNERKEVEEILYPFITAKKAREKKANNVDDDIPFKNIKSCGHFQSHDTNSELHHLIDMLEETLVEEQKKEPDERFDFNTVTKAIADKIQAQSKKLDTDVKKDSGHKLGYCIKKEHPDFRRDRLTESCLYGKRTISKVLMQLSESINTLIDQIEDYPHEFGHIKTLQPPLCKMKNCVDSLADSYKYHKHKTDELVESVEDVKKFISKTVDTFDALIGALELNEDKFRQPRRIGFGYGHGLGRSWEKASREMDKEIEEMFEGKPSFDRSRCRGGKHNNDWEEVHEKLRAISRGEID